MSTLAQCDGILTVKKVNTEITCSTNFQFLNPTDLVLVLSQYDITASSILYVMSWGVGVVLLMWSLGYAVGVAVSLIKKA